MCINELFMNMNRFLVSVFLCMSALIVFGIGKCPRVGVSILGDSYSTFEGYVSPDTNFVWYFSAPRPDLTDVTDVRQIWWHKLIRDKGMRLVVNNSFSGSTICNRGYNGEDYSDRSFLTRVKELGSPDIILVFGATNDSWSGARVGNYERAEGETPDYYTFRPALDRMLSVMKDYYPGTDIYFIINDGLRPEVTESILTLCGKHCVETIELKDIDKKAGHPTVKGMSQIAEQVGKYF